MSPVRPRLTGIFKNMSLASKLRTFRAVFACIILFMPNLFISPALLAMGFSSAGPVAGTLASAFQSAFGAAMGFSFLQGAAMGGAAASTAAISVQVGAALSLVRAAFLKFRGKW